MQKYKSNIITTTGLAQRNISVRVLDDNGALAALYADRYGQTPIANPQITAVDGTFAFYAANGRYSLQTTINGVTYTDQDVVLAADPEDMLVAGPIADAVNSATASVLATATSAASAAQASQNAAAGSQGAAAASESNAASSASAASGSAATASGAAGAASASEANAHASENAAATSAGNAATSESNALASKNAAAAAAANAATYAQGYANGGAYAAGITLNDRFTFLAKDGELYRLADAVALPYITTGDWASESIQFVSIGDRVLRQELTDAADPTKGASLLPTVARAAKSMYELLQVPTLVHAIVYMRSFYAGRNLGGSTFVWDATCDKATANGGTIIDPGETASYDGTPATRDAFLAAQGTGVGAGCWVSVDVDRPDVAQWGVAADSDPAFAYGSVQLATATDDTYAIQKALNAVDDAPRTQSALGNWSDASTRTLQCARPLVCKTTKKISTTASFDLRKMVLTPVADAAAMPYVLTFNETPIATLSVYAPHIGLPRIVGKRRDVNSQVDRDAISDGVRITGVWNADISGSSIEGVRDSFTLVGHQWGTGWCKVEFSGIIKGCRFGVRLGTINGGWCNENELHIRQIQSDRLGWWSTTEGAMLSFEAGASHNTALKPALETYAGQEVPYSVLFMPGCEHNECVGIRLESHTTPPQAVRYGGVACRITGNVSYDGTSPILVDSPGNANSFRSPWQAGAPASILTPYDNGYVIQAHQDKTFHFRGYVYNSPEDLMTPALINNITNYAYEISPTKIAMQGSGDYADSVYLYGNHSSAYTSGGIAFQTKSDGSVVALTGTDGGYVAAEGNGIQPATDGIANLGRPNNRWATVYATTGTINTSDEREKTTPEDVPQVALRAWADVRPITYKWLASVREKGGAARTHVGVIAQAIKRAFEAHGLNACEYGLLCHDKWDANPELGREAGDRWGVRTTECLWLEAAYQRSVVSSLEARVIALESR